MELTFWISLLTVFYTLFGYGLIMALWSSIKKKHAMPQKGGVTTQSLQAMTVIIPAFNEEALIADKICDTFAQDYPRNKLNILVLADGSTDRTARKVRALQKKHKGLFLLYKLQRRGKAMALNRAMRHVHTPITVSTDTDTRLAQGSLRALAQALADPSVGLVGGAKKVLSKNDVGQSEGLYWKYEHHFKMWDSQVGDMMGAAGELLAFRSEVYPMLESDTILDDFMMSFRVRQQGYRVRYCPDAKAYELPTSSYAEEWKRKVRIAAGGLQSIQRLRGLFAFWRDPLLSFQFISHRVLRWTVLPWVLLLAFISNLYLFGQHWVYSGALLLQASAYLSVLFSVWFPDMHKLKGLKAMRYFVYMQLSALQGLYRFILGKQSAKWEKASKLTKKSGV